MYWVSQNPPPAHIFLISGDRNFAGTLHRLRMSNYNILLATPEKTPTVLHSAATIAWMWDSLLNGESLTGKVLNHPPDGPLGSWYGSYKEPVTVADPATEEPVTVAAPQATSLPNVEVYGPSKITVPKSVLTKICNILSSHPKGMSIGNLRGELMKNHVRLDKNWYGHKKFSRFLLSLPQVDLRSTGDSSFSVHLVPVESMEPCKNSSLESTVSDATNEEKGCAEAPKVNCEGKSKVRDADGKLSIASVSERSMGDDLKSVQPGPSKGRPVEENELRKSAVDVGNAPQSETELPHEDSKDSKTKMDTLKKSCKKLSANNTARSKVAGMEKHTTKDNLSAGNDQSMVENNVMANYESGNFEAKNKCENRTSKEVDDVFPSLSPPIDDSEAAQKPVGSAETNKRSPTLFHWIRRWWPFGKNNEKYDDLTAHQREGVSHVEDSKLSELEQTVSQTEEAKSSELDHTVSQSEEPKLSELNQNGSHSGKPELFSSVSFWNDMESFMFAPKGSFLFSQSRSRLVCNLVLYRSCKFSRALDSRKL